MHVKFMHINCLKEKDQKDSTRLASLKCLKSQTIRGLARGQRVSEAWRTHIADLSPPLHANLYRFLRVKREPYREAGQVCPAPGLKNSAMINLLQRGLSCGSSRDRSMGYQYSKEISTRLAYVIDKLTTHWQFERQSARWAALIHFYGILTDLSRDQFTRVKDPRLAAILRAWAPSLTVLGTSANENITEKTRATL